MRRIFIILSTLLVAIPLTMGVLAGVSFYNTSEENLPSPTISVMGTTLAPAGHDWQEPVFGGVLYRHFLKRPEGQAEHIGKLTDPALTVTLPSEYTATATIFHGGSRVWSGRSQDLDEYLFLDNGRYELQVVCTRPEGEDKKGHGSFTYAASFSVSVEPEMETSDDWVAQGDVFAIRLSNIAADIQPVLKCDFGEFVFTQSGPGAMTAYLPITWSRATGDYTLAITAGQHSWEVPIRVTSFNFPMDSLGTSSGTRDPAASSEAALAEFEETVPPLYAIDDDPRMWQGRFINPVEGGVVTGEYGVLQYINLRPVANRSEGVEITAVTGTPVYAANAGQVILAEHLQNTGNTVIIAHGGGLKTFYYYMDELTVEPGDKVATGDQIGTVGSTGDAAGAHLRFEVRIGEETISPSLLLNGSSSLYTFELKANGSGDGNMADGG